MLGFLGDLVDQFKSMPTGAKLAVVGALGVGGYLTYRAVSGHAAGGSGAASGGGGSIPIDLASPTPADQIYASGGQPIGSGTPAASGGGSSGSGSSGSSSSSGGGSSPIPLPKRKPKPKTGGGEVHNTPHVAHGATAAHVRETAHGAPVSPRHPAIMYGVGNVPHPTNEQATRRGGITIGHGRVF